MEISSVVSILTIGIPKPQAQILCVLTDVEVQISRSCCTSYQLFALKMVLDAFVGAARYERLYIDMKALTLIFASVIFSSSALSQDIEGEVIFSVEVIEWALLRGPEGSASPEGRTGVFFYYKEGAPDAYGPTITGYKLQNGRVDSISGNGSTGTEILLRKLRAIPVSSFNVEAEVESTIDNLRLMAERNGTSYSPPASLDGAKYKIVFAFGNVAFEYSAWNPGPLIDDLAQHNPNIADFKDVIDLFATSYGRNAFGL